MEKATKKDLTNAECPQQDGIFSMRKRDFKESLRNLHAEYPIGLTM